MLLLVTTHQGNISVYLENLVDLDRAIQHDRFKKHLRADKLGNTLLLSYDETKRMLAVCAVEKVSRYRLNIIHGCLFCTHSYKYTCSYSTSVTAPSKALAP